MHLAAASLIRQDPFLLKIESRRQSVGPIVDPHARPRLHSDRIVIAPEFRKISDPFDVPATVPRVLIIVIPRALNSALRNGQLNFIVCWWHRFAAPPGVGFKARRALFFTEACPQLLHVELNHF